MPGKKPKPVSRDAFDSPWKEAIVHYLPQFLALLFPAAYARIDWARPPELLDTELRRVVREAATGDQRADLLFKVYLVDGGEQFILAHVEVQATEDRELADRMFRYCYRIFDRHHHFVAGFAVLGDEQPAWNPDCFSWEALGSRLTWQFQTAKLLDWEGRWPELVASRNPFATVLMSHLKTKRTRKDPASRLEWKLRLVRHIYANHSQAEGQELLRLVDWMMQLPAEQTIIYEEGLEALEAEHRMGYIPTFARKHWDAGLAQGLEQGHAEGLAEGEVKGRTSMLARQLEKRFGPLPAAAKRLLKRAEVETVEQWGLRLLDAGTLEDVFGFALRETPKPRARRSLPAE